MLVAALPSSVIDPLWGQFAALISEPEDTYRLGCHRGRVSVRVVFDKLLQVLVFGTRLRQDRRSHLLGDDAAPWSR